VIHFHGYAYTGHGYTDSEIHAGRAPSRYLPIEVDCTSGPDRHLATLNDAMTWLEAELTRHEPLDAEAFPVKVRLEYSRSRLQQSAGAIVVYGYWSRAGQYVARRILPCAHCPN
jgi:hypothetical protein